jgi:hypothetical protein
MYLSQLLLAITLGLWSFNILFNLAVNIKTIAVLALATAICLILEGLGVFNWNLKRPRE